VDQSPQAGRPHTALSDRDESVSIDDIDWTLVLVGVTGRVLNEVA